MTWLLDDLDGSPESPQSVQVDEELLAGLNPQQREAVLYRGPALLIVAGAGSARRAF